MSHQAIVKTLLVAVALLLGVIVGLIAGLLNEADGSSVPAAVVVGGVAFSGTVGLTLVIVGFLRKP